MLTRLKCVDGQTRSTFGVFVGFLDGGRFFGGERFLDGERFLEGERDLERGRFLDHLLTQLTLPFLDLRRKCVLRLHLDIELLEDDFFGNLDRLLFFCTVARTRLFKGTSSDDLVRSFRFFSGISSDERVRNEVFLPRFFIFSGTSSEERVADTISAVVFARLFF